MEPYYYLLFFDDFVPFVFVLSLAFLGISIAMIRYAWKLAFEYCRLEINKDFVRYFSGRNLEPQWFERLDNYEGVGKFFFGGDVPAWVVVLYHHDRSKGVPLKTIGIHIWRKQSEFESDAEAEMHRFANLFQIPAIGKIK